MLVGGGHCGLSLCAFLIVHSWVHAHLAQMSQTDLSDVVDKYGVCHQLTNHGCLHDIDYKHQLRVCWQQCRPDVPRQDQQDIRALGLMGHISYIFLASLMASHRYMVKL